MKRRFCKPGAVSVRSAASLIYLFLVIQSQIVAVQDNDEAVRGQSLLIAQLSPTPLTVQINSPTPLPLMVETATPTFTPDAVELQTSAVLQAKQTAGEVNVRFEANIDSERVGTIEFGDQYVVTGKYLRWYQIAFEDSLDGTGWVFDELVDVTGDTSTIPDFGLTPLPTADDTLVAATQTAAVLLLTPGAVLSATANLREISEPVAAINSDGTTVVDQQGTALPENTPLPTFTFPPEIASQATPDPGQALPEATTAPSIALTPEDVPPILPIAILGGFGLLGLAVASLRR